MTCHKEHYQYIVDCIIGWFSSGVDMLAPLLGRWLAIAAVMVLMVPLAIVLGYISKVLIPKFVRWYYEESINQKARQYWRMKCVGTGMNIRGAKISIALGLVFFFLVRIVLSLPAYYRISIPLLIAVFMGVAVVGCFVSGNVPTNSAAQFRYLRRFHAPTVTGLGLGLATIVLDFLVQLATVALAHLHTS